jgi:signal transduction histidine kinase
MGGVAPVTDLITQIRPSAGEQNKEKQQMNDPGNTRYGGLLFSDPALEAEFRAYWQRLNLRILRLALLLAAVLTAGFHWLDRAFLEPPQLAVMTAFRFGFMLPGALAVLALTYSGRAVPYLGYFLWPAFLLSAAVFGATAAAGGADLANYLLSSMVQLLLFAMILLRMHFLPSAALAAGMIAIYVGAVMRMGLPPDRLANLIASILAIGVCLAIAAYSRETTFRRLFMAQRSLEIAEEKTRRAERERLSWLERFARFLRHEMTSQISGARSSLKLLAESDEGQDTSVYVDRAEQCIDRMSELLDSASDATSLPTALDRRDEEPVDLLDIVRAQARTFALRYPDMPLVLQCGGPAIVRGDPLRLVQLTDKLLANAFEHAAEGSEVEVSCLAEADKVVLTVSNAGQPLPADREAIFEPWVSLGGKVRTSASHGQGIGLYVASKIAEHHGGRLIAHDRQRTTGARFQLELPVPGEATSPGDSGPARD